MQLKNTYQNLPPLFYSEALPSAAVNPFTVLYNSILAKELGLQLSENEITNYLSGLQLPANVKPIAQAYAGHQFGHFNMLGDGRAVLLGEISAANNAIFDVQLKGAGATPYSRRGDGKCALSSALREYIYSESMHALGIATTRSLAVVATGSPVYRQIAEPGAVLTRIAKSHIRFGTFEYAARLGNTSDVQALLDYTVEKYFPQIINAENKAAAFLQIVIENQMKLIVQWMRVGFIHGVMNTDNMSISGQTIDFGPCAFMNAYDTATVYSQIDTHGRYAFGQQPNIAHWNLVRFAETLLPLINANQEEAIARATTILETANTIFEKEYVSMMHAKIGIENVPETPLDFIEKLLQWMQINKADYTNTFLQLMGKNIAENEIYTSADWQVLMQNWRNALKGNNVTEAAALIVMQENNPNYIPRNTNVDTLINDYLNTANIEPIEKFLSQMQSTYSLNILDTTLCSYLPENNFSTHCNT